MTPEQLRERQAQAEAEFDALENEKDKINTRLNEILTRQAELRGQYQLITEQLAAAAVVSPSADVIDVDAALTKKEKK